MSATSSDVVRPASGRIWIKADQVAQHLRLTAARGNRPGLTLVSQLHLPHVDMQSLGLQGHGPIISVEQARGRTERRRSSWIA